MKYNPFKPCFHCFCYVLQSYRYSSKKTIEKNWAEHSMLRGLFLPAPPYLLLAPPYTT